MNLRLLKKRSRQRWGRCSFLRRRHPPLDPSRTRRHRGSEGVSLLADDEEHRSGAAESAAVCGEAFDEWLSGLGTSLSRTRTSRTGSSPSPTSTTSTISLHSNKMNKTNTNTAFIEMSASSYLAFKRKLTDFKIYSTALLSWKLDL